MAEFDGEYREDQRGGGPAARAPWVVAWRVGRSMPAFGVPRRFGIGTLFIVTAAYGVLLTGLRAMDWHRGVIAAFVGFISLVGLGQMLLFGARRPRRASIVTGAVCVPLVQLLIFSMLDGRNRGHPLHWLDGGELLIWLFSLFSSTLFGAAAGYLAGGVVAGVFLIMDAVERAIGKNRASAIR